MHCAPLPLVCAFWPPPGLVAISATSWITRSGRAAGDRNANFKAISVPSDQPTRLTFDVGMANTRVTSSSIALTSLAVWSLVTSLGSVVLAPTPG